MFVVVGLFSQLALLSKWLDEKCLGAEGADGVTAVNWGGRSHR